MFHLLCKELLQVNENEYISKEKGQRKCTIHLNQQLKG